MDGRNCQEIIIALPIVLVKVRKGTQSRKYAAKHKYITQRSNYSGKDITRSVRTGCGS
jgi:hypothetical protein